MRNLILCFLLSFCQLSVVAQNDSQLLQDIASICTSENHGDEELSKLYQGAEKFGIEELSDLATMRKNRELDIQNRCCIAATKALLGYAEKKYGKESREAVVCRRQVIACYDVVDFQKAHEIAVENVRCAEVLREKSGKDKQCKLLDLTVQLELIVVEKTYDEDNPYHWEKLYQIEKELEPYFKGKIVYSLELIDACQYIANLQECQTSYVEYVDRFRRKFFPNGHYLQGRIYANDLFSNKEAFMQHAVDGARALWGDRDMRAIAVDIEQLTIQMRNQLVEFNTVHDRLREIQNYLRDYLPYGNVYIDRLELLLWECDIRYGEKLHEIRSAYPILLRVKTCYGEESEMYLNMISQLTTLTMLVDIGKGKPLLEESEDLIERLCQPGTDAYDMYLKYLITSKQSMSFENPQVLQSYMSKCYDYYQQKHRASWESVFVGKNIASVYSSSLLLTDKAAEIQLTVLKDLELLVGKESLVYASCLSQLASYFSMSQDKTSWRKAMDFCKEAIDIYERFNFLSGESYRLLSDTQRSLEQKEEAMQTLRTGIQKCTKPEDGMWRCLMQLLLGWELHSDLGYSMEGEPKRLFEEAIPFYNAHIEEVSGSYMEGFLLISYYYQSVGQLDKAEDMLKCGMEHHERLYGEYDYIYSQMLSDLYNLYADGLNDMDKAEQVLEGRLEAIRKQPSFSLNYVVLQLLWNRYYLLSRKSNDWLLRFTLLNEIVTQIKLMAELAGKDDAVKLQSIAMPILYEYASLFPVYGNYLKEAHRSKGKYPAGVMQEQIDALQRQETSLRDMFKNSFLPEFLEKERQLKENSHSYLDNWETLNLYVALASCYIGIERDSLTAETYLRELLKSNVSGIKYRAVSELAGLKVAQNNYKEAVILYEQQKSLAEQVPLAMASIEDKANFYSSLWYPYSMCGRFSEAINSAKEFHRLRKRLANQNFDLLTQTEREHFIEKGGIGEAGIIYLLPKFPQDLSEEGYNVMLESKGLLLRASERIKKAILQSGNQEMIAQIDSLNRLTAHYKTMNIQTDWTHGNYNIDSEVVKIRQQIESLERNINRQAAQFIEGMNTPDWKKLQSVLKEDEAAVEYVLSDSVSCGALVLLSQGEPQYVPLTPSNELWRSLDELKSLDAQRKAETLYQEDKLCLYDKLWKPIEKKLKGVKTVYYSPTGFLNDFAYAAFRCADGSYLSDHYELHQMLSTGDLVALREKTNKEPVKSASLFGGVFYSPDHEQLADRINLGTAQRGLAQDGRGAILDEEEVFGYLSFTRQEIEAVGNIFKEYQISASLMCGYVPTEKTLHDFNGNSPQVLHLSTHGFFVNNVKALENKFLARFPSTRFSSMQRSGLALVDANRTWGGATDNPEETDGILTANEVAMLDLSKTRLAVLSACQTAVGEYSLEGVYGMHRGFKQAGVKSILASLWNVNDKSTSRLMELFYERWLSGMPMQKSLNEAINALRKEYPSPFYWAPFVLMDAEN